MSSWHIEQRIDTTTANGPHQWTAVTLWAAVLASIGWKWTAPYSLLVDGTRYDLRDMTAKEQKTLDHLLRQALRNRELQDVRADIRRGRQRKRAEFEGVDEPIDWDRTPRLGSALPPQEEGVWYTIVSGGVLARDTDACKGCSGRMMCIAGLYGGGA